MHHDTHTHTHTHTHPKKNQTKKRQKTPGDLKNAAKGVRRCPVLVSLREACEKRAPSNRIWRGQKLSPCVPGANLFLEPPKNRPIPKKHTRAHRGLENRPLQTNVVALSAEHFEVSADKWPELGTLNETLVNGTKD